MHPVIRFLVVGVGLAIGLWLLFTFGEQVIAALTPYLGGAAAVVAVAGLLAGPTVLLAALAWRLS
jgi:hypothetical protein